MKTLQDDQERLINSDGTAANDDGNDDGDSAGGVHKSADGLQDESSTGSDGAGKRLLQEHSADLGEGKESPLPDASPWRRKIFSNLQQYSQPGRKLKFRGKND